MSRDERAILTTVLERAGLRYQLVESGAFPFASLAFASPELPDGASFRIDAPGAWLRVSTTIAAPPPDRATRHALGLIYLRTGLGHVHYDDTHGAWRVAASLQAVDAAPTGSALLATLHHLGDLRLLIEKGEREIRAVVDPAPLPDEPTFADVARALEQNLTLVAQGEGVRVGGLREPRSGLECAVRAHTPEPGIFAFDVWCMPPERLPVDDARVVRVDRFETTLEAGSLLLFSDGFLVYRWACPYRWLDAAQLATPVVAHVALDAFLRWRASGAA